MTARRTRGRPSGGGGDTREGILNAARELFAARGFAGTSLREIARVAGVDASLISHYFGGKEQLLVATMQLPINPIEKIASVLAGETADMADRLIRTFLDAWDPHREVFSTMVRTSMGGDDQQAPAFQVARNVVIASFSERLEGPDAEVRASLIASQLVGMAILRYVVQIEALAEASIDEMARLYAPAIQTMIDG